MRLTIGTLATALLLATGAGPAPGPALPPIVFVSRERAPGSDPTAVPGLGPRGRSLAPGGRLLLREPDGRVRPLLPEGTLHDVSGPCVSPDGRRVAFAGTPAPDSAWRIWQVGLDGAGLAPLTRGGRRIDLEPLGSATARFARYDDLDPCWVDDSTLCFASTREPQLAQYGGEPATNLFLARLGEDTVRRLTSERNGAETPTMDFRRGRIVFARWWHNRWLASDDPPGLTDDPARALPRDTVNLWHAMEIAPDGSGERLACGDPPARLGAMAYRPAILADGSIVGVYATNSGLSPSGGGLGLQRFAPRFSAGRRLVGAIVDPGRAGYGSPAGLAPASACAPAALSDGRLLFAYDPGGRGDFGIWVMNADGSGRAPVVDLPGTLELDPAPVVIRPRVARAARPPDGPPPGLPFTTLEGLRRHPRRFRFLDLDVFAPPRPGRADPGGRRVEPPPTTAGARIRFWATLARPAAAGGDTAVLLREAAIGPGGRVDERDLPAETPLFEQLVGPDGRVLRSGHGPAHVAGLNAGAPGGTTRCLGCHAGHSILLRGR